MTLSPKGFGGFFGAVATVTYSATVIQPYVLEKIGMWLCAMFAASLSFMILVFAARLCRDPQRRLRKWRATSSVLRFVDPFEFNLISVAVLISINALMLFIVISWQNPSRGEISQQILADRGMRLERNYYQTAIETRNTQGVKLFHESGFHPQLAFILLGRTSLTRPPDLTVDVLLDFDGGEFRNMVEILTGQDEMDRDETPRPINASLIHSRMPRGEAADVSDAGAQPDSITLISRALELGKTQAAVTLLALGADLGNSTLDLIDAGRLPPSLVPLVADPFVALSDRYGLDDDAKEELAIELRRTQFYPTLFALGDTVDGRSTGPIPGSDVTCSRLSDAPFVHFIGVRGLPAGGRQLVGFRVDATRSCTAPRYQLEGVLVSDAPRDSTALVVRGPQRAIGGMDTASTSTRLLIASRQGDSIQLSGGTRDRLTNLIQTAAGPTHLRLARSSLGLDRVRSIIQDVRSLPPSDTVRCGSSDPLQLTSRATLISCSGIRQFTLPDGAGDVLVVIIDDDAGLQHVLFGAKDQVNPGQADEFVAVAIALNGSESKATPLEYVTRASCAGVVSGTNVSELQSGPGIDCPISVSEIETTEFTFDITGWSQLDIALTDFNSDLDLFLWDGQEIVESSMAVGTSPDSISSVVPPGRYRLEVDPFDGASDAQLYIERTELAVNALGLAGAPLTVNDTLTSERGTHLWTFDVADSTSVDIALEPGSADADLRLRSETGSILSESTAAGTDFEFIGERLPAGRYVIEVFLYERDSGPTEYVLTIEPGMNNQNRPEN